MSILIITGHYGVGKTNLAINLALDAAKVGREVTLVDLDIVNPYFRSSEYRALLEQGGVQVIAPVFAERGTSLDVPSLTGAIIPAIELARNSAQIEANENERVSAECVGEQKSWLDRIICAPHDPLLIIDVGGDDAGATALGRYARYLQDAPYELLYVTNPLRNLTQDAQEAYEIMQEIEQVSHLRVTALASNAHLQKETDEQVIEQGVAFAHELEYLSEVPFVFATIPNWLFDQENDNLYSVVDNKKRYCVSVFVKCPWD